MNIGIKKIIFILSGVIIFIVIIILVIAGVAAQRGADLSLEYNLHEPDVPVVQQQQKSTESVTDTFVPLPLTEEEKAGREIERFVASFIERFGTFSNQNEFSHLESLKMFTSDQFYLWARQNTESSAAGIADPALYYGISTKSLDVFTKSDDELTRVYTVVTQRQESRGANSNSRLYSQEVEVELVKKKDVWLVNGVFWQNEES
ncbi:MAG: hypothetical protein HOA84_03680 [Candidatus Jacksonbacteria bacterium]|nr:hypothetical protein [Candidatus Jacksonbacteria bacterium]